MMSEATLPTRRIVRRAVGDGEHLGDGVAGLLSA